MNAAGTRAAVLAVMAALTATDPAPAAQHGETASGSTARVVSNVELAVEVFRGRREAVVDLGGEVARIASTPAVGDGGRGAQNDDDAGRDKIDAALSDLNPHLRAARRVAELREQGDVLTARATLEPLQPLLGDLSLPEDPELWLAAGELANRANDTQLAALAAAMVCRTHDLEDDGRALRVVMDALLLVRPGDIREAAREREAIVGFHHAALDGDARAMGEVGKRYAYSAGVPRDREQALRWWRRGAEAGDGQSMERLGSAYSRGDLVEKDPDQARVWYERAAEAYHRGAKAGDAEAMFHLSGLYRGGLGVEKDQAAGRAWLERAAEAGSGWAGHTLAMGQHNGEFEDMTAEEAAQWDRKAAESGFMLAINTMAWRYLEGHGVEKDEAKAMEWYRRAARRGDEYAREKLERRWLGW